jgi:Malectin-like domain
LVRELSYASENRYPEDAHDRLWFPVDCKKISTNSSIQITHLDVPSSVLQTAAVPSVTTISMEISLVLPYNNQSYFLVLHFAEVQIKGPTDIREFKVYINGTPHGTVTPVKFSQSYLELQQTLYDPLVISLVPTDRATLPPILNAIEIYRTLPVISAPTDNVDGISFSIFSCHHKSFLQAVY